MLTPPKSPKKKAEGGGKRGEKGKEEKGKQGFLVRTIYINM
jgi:hypothetical protein